MNKVTIVTTTYNHENFIGQALDSFLSQKTNFKFEVLVVDDCSTDSTPKIISEYAKKYPEIIKPVLNKKNIGSMTNFIKTLGMVKSEYVAFCDGDDFWCDNNKLQLQVDFLNDHPDCNTCFHQTKVFFQEGKRPDEIFPLKKFPKITSFKDLIKENYIPANTVMYRWQYNKKKIANVIPSDIVPGDYYVHLLHAKSGKIGFINKVMSCYRRHDGGMWWLSCQKNGQDSFMLKYGIPYLNFYKSVEKNFNLDSNTYYLQKENLVNSLIKCYLENNMFVELFNLRDNNTDLFNSCIVNFNYKRMVYNNLSRTRRIMYQIFVEPINLRQKIISNLKRIPVLGTVLIFGKNSFRSIKEKAIKFNKKRKK